MEPKPNFALVGIFITLLTLAGLGMVAWFLGINTQKQYDEYVVLTKYSVSGLHKDSDVRYKGVKVGRVLGIEIDKNNPEYIKIYIAVEKNLPVKTDTRARITTNGLTGIAYIDLVGGTKEAPLLRSISHARYPVIKTVPTMLDRLTALADKVMGNINLLLEKLNGLINDNTSRYLNGALKHIYNTSESVDILSKRLMDTQHRLDRLIDDTDGFVVSLKRSEKSLNRVLDKVLSLTDEAKKLTENADSVVREAGSNIEKSSRDVARFTSTALDNVNELIVQMNRAVNRLDMLLNEIESDPSLIIKGRKSIPGPGEIKR